MPDQVKMTKNGSDALRAWRGVWRAIDQGSMAISESVKILNRVVKVGNRWLTLPLRGGVRVSARIP